VETRHGIGTFVLDTPSPSGFRVDPATIVTLRDVLAILELRISLEVESAGLAAQRRSPEQLAAMRAALDALGYSASHAGDTVAADFQFHLLIAEATGAGSTVKPQEAERSAGVIAGVVRDVKDVFKRYLDALDGSKMFFTADDVAKIHADLGDGGAGTLPALAHPPGAGPELRDRPHTRKRRPFGARRRRLEQHQ